MSATNVRTNVSKDSNAKIHSESFVNYLIWEGTWTDKRGRNSKRYLKM